MLEDFRCEEVNPAVNARADESFWFLDVMCHLVRRSVLNDTTVVQGLLPRGLLKTKRKIKLGTFLVHNYLLSHHPNCNIFSNVRCSTFPGTSQKTLVGAKPCFVSESFKMEIRSVGRHHIEEGVGDRRSSKKKTSAQQILVPLIFVLNFGDASTGFQSRDLQEENIPL